MSWKDNLRDASFRGVSFFVPSHELQGGRRLVTHEYPLRDEPYTEDMGLKARRYGVEAYVVGDDYMSARDSLVEALNKGGEGELIHPYLGTLTVQCESYTMSEASEEGRMARFSIQFVESGESKYPSESKDREAAVDMAAGTLDGAAAELFAENFSVEGQPEFVSVSALTLIESFLSVVGAEIANVKSRIAHPTTLAAVVQGLISSLASDGEGYTANVAALVSLGAFGEYRLSPLSSQSAMAMAANNDAIVSLIRLAAAAEASRCAAATEYETRQDAEAACRAITGIIDDEADRTLDSRLYMALSKLRCALVNALPSDTLPELVDMEIIRPVASLVLAYEVYGDALRADEIVMRNGTPHPGFISGTVRIVSEG
ncbi:MAG: DNA circularization N-terminal domain-containing protein [bacterium]|nr:DNA circularization N-terminal domain-containing protein [bacterium]